MCKAHDDGNDSTSARVIDAIDIGNEHKNITLCGMASKLACMNRIVT